MRKILFISMIMLGSIKGFCCQPGGIIFGEITFMQDSVNPLKFYFKVKIDGGAFCSFQTDSCLMQWTCPWTDFGSLPLADTMITDNTTASFPVLIYGGWHTFDSIPPDSLITVSFSAEGRVNSTNGEPNPALTPFCISTTLNMAYLVYHTGVQSVHFNAPMMTQAVAGEVMYFDPMIQYEAYDSLWVNIGLPMADCSNIAGYIYPYQYLPSSHNTMTLYHPTGFLIWNNPPLADALTAWDITFMASDYRNGVFAYSVMRDMIINVVPNTTGLTDMPTGNGLRCYPSPASGSFTIDMTGYEAGKKQISIYDQLGQVAYQTESMQDKIQVNENLSSGIYTVAVTQGTRQYTRVVIE